MHTSETPYQLQAPGQTVSVLTCVQLLTFAPDHMPVPPPGDTLPIQGAPTCVSAVQLQFNDASWDCTDSRA